MDFINEKLIYEKRYESAMDVHKAPRLVGDERCFLRGVEYSAPYSNTDKTQALYSLLLMDKLRFPSRKTAFLSAPKAYDP